MGINSWIFLKESKPAFLHPPPPKNGWLVDITAAMGAPSSAIFSQFPEDNTLVRHKIPGTFKYAHDKLF
jgi:hypothetical protein